MISNFIQKEYEELEKEKYELESKILELPPGKLISSWNKTRFKYYQSDGKNRKYILRENRRLAELLALKRYFLHRLEVIQSELKALDYYLRYHKQEISTEEFLRNNPGIRELLVSNFKPLSQKQAEWMNADYKRNEYQPEQKNHETVSGYKVRSKSEVLIDMVLSQNHIAFHYEEELCLGNKILFPDFTIRHPKTDKVLYWEHFGMMDDEKYKNNAISKLKLYLDHHIIPDINLITTYETSKAPLSYGQVKTIIERFFLQ